MIEKDVILFVRGEQRFDQLEPEVTELTTPGVMTIAEDGEIALTYQETELTGMEGTSGVNSQIIFQRGKRHSSLYETPWGMMLVDVSTTSLAHRLGSRGGILELKFNIAVDHQITGENRFKIRVRESAR